MNKKLVVFDDDPTGIQTVHGCYVLTVWDEATLATALQDEVPFFYLLTNIRALPPGEAARVLAEACTMVKNVARNLDIEIEVLSRSDSTLRSHFPLEVATFLKIFAFDTPVDGIIFAPAFFESGRITAGDIHYVVENNRRIPADETEFSNDPDFPYSTAYLPGYILEKLNSSKITGPIERIDADAILSIPLNLIRSRGTEGVTEFLLKVTQARFMVVNAETYDDLDTVTAAVRIAVEQGKRFFYHTSSSFVRSFMQQSAKLIDFSSVETGPGLVVVGSYVQKTQRQLSKLLEIPVVEGIPITVDEIVSHPKDLKHSILGKISKVLSNGKTAALYLEKSSKATEISRGDVMDTGHKITSFFCSCVNELQVRPSFILGKGGITSHELLKRGLKVAFARVAGQAVPGVPVIRMNSAHRFSGMYYAIFPGNVGSDDTLAEVVSRFINDKHLQPS